MSPRFLHLPPFSERDLANAKSVTLLIHGVGNATNQSLLRSAGQGFVDSGLDADLQSTTFTECPALSKSPGDASGMALQRPEGPHLIVALPWADRRRRLSQIAAISAIALLVLTTSAIVFFLCRSLIDDLHTWLNGSRFHLAIAYALVIAISYLGYLLKPHPDGFEFRAPPLGILLIPPLAGLFLTLFAEWGTWLWVPMLALIVGLWLIATIVVVDCLFVAPRAWKMPLVALALALMLSSAGIGHLAYRAHAAFQPRFSGTAATMDPEDFPRSAWSKPASNLNGSETHLFPSSGQREHRNPVSTQPASNPDASKNDPSLAPGEVEHTSSVPSQKAKSRVPPEATPKTLPGFSSTVMSLGDPKSTTSGAALPRDRRLSQLSFQEQRKRIREQQIRAGMAQYKARQLYPDHEREKATSAHGVSVAGKPKVDLQPSLVARPEDFKNVQAMDSTLSDIITWAEFEPTITLAAICVGISVFVLGFNWLLDFALDVLHYAGDEYEREVLVHRAAEAIYWFHEKAPSARVIVVGHSLGSVIAAHSVASLVKSGRSLPYLVLVTLGSPLNYLGRAFPRAAQTASDLSRSICPRVLWINLWRNRDFVGKALNIDSTNAVQYCVANGSHLGYWSQGAVWRAIAHNGLNAACNSSEFPSSGPRTCLFERRLGVLVFAAVTSLTVIGAMLWRW